MNVNITDYVTADQVLGDRDRRKIKHNTYLERDGDAIRILYHRTFIVNYFRDGNIEVNNGGWDTVTTKTRINEYTPSWFHIRQMQHKWYIVAKDRSFNYEDGSIFQWV